MHGMTVNLSEAEKVELQRLSEQSNQSKVAVIRQAIRVFAFLLSRSNDGWEIVVRKGDRVENVLIVGQRI